MGAGFIYGSYKEYKYVRAEYLKKNKYYTMEHLIMYPIAGGTLGAIGGALLPLGLSVLYVIEYEMKDKD